MRTVDLGKEKIREVLNNEMKEIALLGQVSLNDANVLSCYKLDVLDISKASFGIEQERWSQFLGYGHSGAFYGNSGVRDVEVLKRFLEIVSANKLILPDDVARRHINAIKKNNRILSIEVSDSCKLFCMKDGQLYNKKGTILIFENA